MDEPEFLKDWDDLDDWVRREREHGVSQGFGLCSSLAISFVGTRPDLFVETSPYVAEDADRIVDGLIDMFCALRPDRLAVIWPNMFELPDGDVFLGIRLNLAEPDGAGRWRWTTRVHPYQLDPDDKTRIAEWGPAFGIPKPPDPGSQKLRTIYSAAKHRRMLRRGWVKLPAYDDWDIASHPESTTLDRWQRLDGVDVRNGRLVSSRE